MMDAKQTVSAMVSIWQGKGFPADFPAADACALMMKGWLRINSANRFSLTTEGLAALNLAEQMYARGKEDAPSAPPAGDGRHGGDQEPSDQGTGEHGRQLDAREGDPGEEAGGGPWRPAS